VPRAVTLDVYNEGAPVGEGELLASLVKGIATAAPDA